MADDKIRRREFLKLTGKAALLAAAVGGTELILAQNQYEPLQPPVKGLSGKKNVAIDKSLPDLVSVKSSDHGKALTEAVLLSGGIGRFISKGDFVTIKPNIGWDRSPKQAANTNPILVAAMAALCFDAGAKKVVVADVSCNDTQRCYRRSGIINALKDTQVEIIYPMEIDFVDIDIKGEILGSWQVLRPAVECDKLINMPIVKHHGLSQVTIGMKNWFGAVSGPRNRLHQKIDISIVDLSNYFRPTMVVVDATRVLMRNGPVGGNLDDVEIRDTVAVATDQVAADSFGCRFLNVDPADVGFIAAAEKRGLGKSTGYSLVEKELT